MKMLIFSEPNPSFSFLLKVTIDGLVKSPKTVMQVLIRHPEVIGFTGFRLSPE